MKKCRTSPGLRFCAEADFGYITGGFNRNLHSSNSTPNLSNRGIWDFTPDFTRMNFAFARTNDWSHWNNGQRMVDTYFIFPLMHLDPSDPANYYFDPTDEIIRMCQETGCKVFYRLGASIEHSGLQEDQKHFNSIPPPDYAKYAEVLAGIIRHYTRGWANGFHYDMQYWEIWNEAENNPTCWKGSYEEFIKFFVIVLKRLKQEFPDLKIGGPAATAFRPDLIRPLLSACREAGIAPDFISWHGYNNDPALFVKEPQQMKDLLKEEGFPQCEIAITEWHYLKSWDGIQKNMTEENRRLVLEGTSGLYGIDSASFNLAVLCALQDTPLDLAFYYGSAPKGNWGYFTPYGGYNKNFHSMRIFGDFLKNFTRRIQTESSDASVYLLGGLSEDGKSGQLLAVDYQGDSLRLNVKITGMNNASVSVQLLDDKNNLADVPVSFHNEELILSKNGSGSAVFLITFSRK